MGSRGNDYHHFNLNRVSRSNPADSPTPTQPLIRRKSSQAGREVLVWLGILIAG